jgi:hypothetical protein
LNRSEQKIGMHDATHGYDAGAGPSCLLAGLGNQQTHSAIHSPTQARGLCCNAQALVSSVIRWSDPKQRQSVGNICLETGAIHSSDPNNFACAAPLCLLSYVAAACTLALSAVATGIQLNLSHASVLHACRVCMRMHNGNAHMDGTCVEGCWRNKTEHLNKTYCDAIMKEPLVDGVVLKV